jgi:anti-anti-sigma factor
MFKIAMGNDNQIHLQGKFDAAQEAEAKVVFATISTTYFVNFEKLDYISSAGLGILFETQNRLRQTEHQLKLINMSQHIRDIFRCTGFDQIFEIK